MINETRLLRLPVEKRKDYLVDGLSEMDLPKIRHIASEYGIKNTWQEAKKDLIRDITDALLEWAESQELVS